jgi:hypothetical protein
MPCGALADPLSGRAKRAAPRNNDDRELKKAINVLTKLETALKKGALPPYLEVVELDFNRALSHPKFVRWRGCRTAFVGFTHNGKTQFHSMKAPYASEHHLGRHVADRKIPADGAHPALKALPFNATPLGGFNRVYVEDSKLLNDIKHVREQARQGLGFRDSKPLRVAKVRNAVRGILANWNTIRQAEPDFKTQLNKRLERKKRRTPRRRLQRAR